MDDEDEGGVEIEHRIDEGDPLHALHGLAHDAYCGRLVGVPILFGFHLVDAMKSLQIGEFEARPYVEILRRVRDRGSPPAWC